MYRDYVPGIHSRATLEELLRKVRQMNAAKPIGAYRGPVGGRQGRMPSPARRWGSRKRWV